jgi:hypothetical protein
MLSKPDNYTHWFYDYSVHRYHPNTLCICVRKDLDIGTELKVAQTVLGVTLYTKFERARCPEE